MQGEKAVEQPELEWKVQTFNAPQVLLTSGRKRAAYKENLTREGVEVEGGLTARKFSRMSELCSLLLMPLSLWCEEEEGGGGASSNGINTDRGRGTWDIW